MFLAIHNEVRRPGRDLEYAAENTAAVGGLGSARQENMTKLRPNLASSLFGAEDEIPSLSGATTVYPLHTTSVGGGD